MVKALRWNIGIFIIRIGYLIRYDHNPGKFSLRWFVGLWLVEFGYRLRGNVPQKTWKNNHI